MGQSRKKLLGLAGWMPGDLVLYDKIDPPLGNPSDPSGATVSTQLLKERIIYSLSSVSQASRTHLTISGRGGPRMFPAAVNE